MLKAFLDKLKASCIQVRAKGNRLICRALKGHITHDILEHVKTYKAGILLILKVEQAKKSKVALLTQGSYVPPLLITECFSAESKYLNTIHLGDCLTLLKTLPDNSMDVVITDPPYGIKFMGKDWDKAIPITEIWKECLRVLKPGGFAFIMCLPRQDCLLHMMNNIEAAGFDIGFTSLYWAFAEGFTKRHDISITIDKRECKRMLKESLGRKPTKEEMEEVWGEFRNKIKRNPSSRENCNKSNTILESGTVGKTAYITEPRTNDALKFEGASAGFQPKPTVEVVIVAMKPLDKKTYTDQALSNGKGVTWLSDARIPYSNKSELWSHDSGIKWSPERHWNEDFKRSGSEDGRFPANLLISGNVLDDGKNHPGGSFPAVRGKSEYFGLNEKESTRVGSIKDNGGFSRYFSLDNWTENLFEKLPENIRKCLPFICVPKASRAEKEIGLDDFEERKVSDGRKKVNDTAYQRDHTLRKNTHPTVKSISLMAYLITLGSREGDVVLDPFCGTATTCIAAKLLNRNYIGIEINPEYHEIALARMNAINEIKQGKISKVVNQLLELENDVRSLDNTKTIEAGVEGDIESGTSSAVKRGNSDFIRSFRPHRLSEVYGQEECKGVIEYGLINKSLPHSLFFCGPSGTGKTTFARIVAMGLNCNSGPTSEPCCECESCSRIATLQSLNLFEINSADLSGIDNIRKLRDSLVMKPWEGPLQVFIFDECHRLTPAAQNMLLKLVEDSPDMNYFIFCSTTTKNIEETLINRCTFLEFQKISETEIKRLIHDVCKLEGMQPVDEIIEQITSEADGRVGNALFLIQKAIALGNLKKELITQNGSSLVHDILPISNFRSALQQGELNNKKKIRDFGTKEWAQTNVNCCTGCSHDCRYCYAKNNALRFKRLSYENIEQWKVEDIRQKDVNKGYRKRNGIVMFPSSHDITPNNFDACVTVLEKLLKAGNEVLIVSKPHLECIGPITRRFEQYKKQILFRFTITATDNELLSFWEPGAPAYEERFQCLKIAYHRCFKTSVSVEPMIDSLHIGDLITNVSPIVTETIWIGLMQHLDFIKADDHAIKKAIEKIKAGQTVDIIRPIYEKHKDNPKIRWKESIRKLLGLD